MSEAKSQQEPSMEEILASIRRIIAEDGEASAEAAAPPAPPDDILELTEVVEDEPPPPAPTPAAPPVHAAAEPPEPEPELESFAEEPSWESENERLVSQRAAASSAASFSALAGHLRRRTSPEVLLGNGNATLEEIVKELLRPMLQEWLDAHLPAVVERLVREEIERLGREAL